MTTRQQEIVLSVVHGNAVELCTQCYKNVLQCAICVQALP